MAGIETKGLIHSSRGQFGKSAVAMVSGAITLWTTFPEKPHRFILDATAATTITLPEVATITDTDVAKAEIGHSIIIANVGTFSITIQNHLAAGIVTISSGDGAIIVAEAAAGTWDAFGISGSAGGGISSDTIQRTYNNSSSAGDVPVLLLDSAYRGFDIRDNAVPITANSGTIAGAFDSTGTTGYLVVKADNIFGNKANFIAPTGSDNFVFGTGTNVGANSHNVVIGTSDTITASNVVALGKFATVSTSDGIAIGTGSTAACIAIGPSSTSTGSNSVALGFNSSSTGNESISIGDTAMSQNNETICIGHNALGGGADGSIVIGPDAQDIATAGDNSVVAIGGRTIISGSHSVAIGRDSTNDGDESVCIGASDVIAAASVQSVVLGAVSNTTRPGGIAVGYDIICTGSDGISIGRNSFGDDALGGIAIGAESVVGLDFCTVVGFQAMRPSAASGNGDTILGALSSKTGTNSFGETIVGSRSSSISMGGHTVIVGANSANSNAATQGCIIIGGSDVNLGTGCIIIGELSSVAATCSGITIGQNSSISGASATGAVVVGDGASSTGANAIAIGNTAVTGNDSSIVIGEGAMETAAILTSRNIVIGPDAIFTGIDSEHVQIGASTTMTGALTPSSTIVGSNNALDSGNVVMVGTNNTLTTTTGNFIGSLLVASDITNGNVMGNSDTIIGGVIRPIVIGNLSTVNSAVDDVIIIGTGATASSSDTITIGTSANNSSLSGIVIGNNALATLTDSIVIGHGASRPMAISAPNARDIVIGSFASITNGTDGPDVVIGARSISTATSYSVIVGGDSLNSASLVSGGVIIGGSDEIEASSAGVIVGHLSYISTDSSGVVIGRESNISGINAIAIGDSCMATNDSSIAIGGSTEATAFGSIAIGVNSLASASDAIALGIGSGSSGYGSIAIGTAAMASATDAIALGPTATAAGQGQLVIANSATKATIGGELENDNVCLCVTGGTSGSYGLGMGVIFIANATTIPPANPVGGGILYVSGGALNYRGSAGTVTPIAPA